MAEVAGLVLGGFPLLISALEHYQECFRVLGCLREFKLEYRRCRNRIQQIELDYDLTLDKLFLDLVDSHEELERLKSDPESDKEWAALETRLKERLLPKVYSSYLATMRDMREVMADLEQELGFDKKLFQDKVESNNKQVHGSADALLSRMSYEAQRAKFSLGKERRDDLFAQLEGYTKTLGSLLSQNDDVARLLRSALRRPTSGVQKVLLEFWRHARNIHTLLCQAWKCQCHAHHCVDLLLLYRKTAEVKLDMYFHFDKAFSNPTAAAWTCHRAVITEMKQEKPLISVSTSTIAGAASNPSPNVVSSLALADDSSAKTCQSVPVKKSKGKSFLSALKGTRKATGKPKTAAAGPSVSFAAPSAPQPSGATKAAQSQSQKPELVNDLCCSIREHEKGKPCAGFLADPTIAAEYTILLPRDDQAAARGRSGISLDSLLSDPANIPNRAERYGIALTLASSHLQLHSSAWLGHRWRSKDIIFPVDQSGAALKSFQPYLRQVFNAAPPDTRTTSVDDTFATLGIVLLELCFGKTLEQSPFRKMYQSPTGRPDLVMDRAAAELWFDKSLEGEVGPELADAVAWCLEKRRVKPNDNSWRRELLQAVVEPFRVAHEQLISKVSVT